MNGRLSWSGARWRPGGPGGVRRHERGAPEHLVGGWDGDHQSIKLASGGHLGSYYSGMIPDEYLEGIVTFINSHDEP